MIHPGVYLWGGALGVVILSAHLTSGFSTRLDQKYRSVKKTVESAQTFRQRLDNLRHVTATFNETYPDALTNNDLYSLYRLSGVAEAGADAEPEKMIISRMTPAKANDQLIGASEFMLSMSGIGYSMTAPELGSAVRIADELLSKPYVDAEQLTLKVSPGSRQTRLIFGSYTITLRDPPNSKPAT